MTLRAVACGGARFGLVRRSHRARFWHPTLSRCARAAAPVCRHRVGASLVALRAPFALLRRRLATVMRGLPSIGHAPALRALLGSGGVETLRVVDEIASVAGSLAERRIGALIVLERGTGLRQSAELGVALDALVSADLLTSLFLPYSPLHDGAAFIRDDRVVAAGCFLPLSRNLQLARQLGTRHRAALGVTEETDAVAVVVSEETGRLSLAVDGGIEALAGPDGLRRRLLTLLGAKTVGVRVDLSRAREGDNTLQLSADDVQAPAGINVVRVSPNWVRVAVATAATRALRVVPQLRGSPPPDVQLGRVVVEPPTVQVKGPRTTIEERATVETAPVDVTGLRQSVTRTVGLLLPDSVYPTTQRTVQVTVEIRRDR